MSEGVYLLLLVWNVLVFGIYGLDKIRAVNRKMRIDERVMLLSAFLLGGVGALCGMLVFHHKIRKPIFVIVVPLCVVLNIVTMLISKKFGIWAG